ncbi:endolytic transglycosylase MltG [Candidatus Falkowbacteria bacterium HGW-Falkowbacteria-2]|uniref:Endolytic transglycosylase MltG n=1 Tax=Candidatus Falkowbacteria bacterium HGW-Falkowbacteria-2 TaxID=2013769 RepID=A0A2N2DZD9_9BACT|nr:MAG: endolytic transglycosylase MltG [Candidatus Falkowbacteria bacterium HGW-Falkowbacteria-2]
MTKYLRYTIYTGIVLLVVVSILNVLTGGRVAARLERIFAKEEPVTIAPREEKTVRFIEGWTNKEIAQYLEGQGLWQSEEFLETVGFPQIDYSQEADLPQPVDLAARYEFLKDKPANRGLEGYLYPDTYRVFAASSTPEELVIKMLNNLDRRLTPKMREDIASQGKTIYEIMTMASILEREAPINYATGDNEDARIIAGIFWDRIKVGQALQSCASLAYILGVNKPQYSAEDTAIESPYNTYKYRGLPPGPISNPGILAIEAAIYPTKTNYNYFLTPAGTSDIVYAVTYQEHLNNKYKYLP